MWMIWRRSYGYYIAGLVFNNYTDATEWIAAQAFPDYYEAQLVDKDTFSNS